MAATCCVVSKSNLSKVTYSEISNTENILCVPILCEHNIFFYVSSVAICMFTTEKSYSLLLSLLSILLIEIGLMIKNLPCTRAGVSMKIDFKKDFLDNTLTSKNKINLWVESSLLLPNWVIWISSALIEVWIHLIKRESFANVEGRSFFFISL